MVFFCLGTRNTWQQRSLQSAPTKAMLKNWVCPADLKMLADMWWTWSSSCLGRCCYRHQGDPKNDKCHKWHQQKPSTGTEESNPIIVIIQNAMSCLASKIPPCARPRCLTPGSTALKASTQYGRPCWTRTGQRPPSGPWWWPKSLVVCCPFLHPS